jgi:hypothetical protein
MATTHLIRLAQALVLAAIIAAFAVPTALGGTSSGTVAPDVFERYAAAHPFGHGVFDAAQAPDVFERYAATHGPIVLTDGRSPDTRDAAEAARLELAAGGSPASDVFERYAAAHPFGHGVLDATTAPDVFERYAATHEPAVLIDGRSPDTRDAAEAARLQLAGGSSSATIDAASAPQTIELVRPGGFDWGDAGIGAIGAAAMIVVIGGAMLLLVRPHRRQRVPLT